LRVVLATCLSLAVAGALPAAATDEAGAEAWRSFEGTWSATGRRRSVAVEGGAVAAIVEVSGAVVLTSGDGLSRGFRGQAVGFDDGQGLTVGRCVWRDERGDLLFSRLEGDGLQAGRHFVGTITGGTGRYADLTGEYAFTWQYVIAADDDVVQGRTVGLSGRVRRASVAR
jgi:hypothetical protein